MPHAQSVSAITAPRRGFIATASAIAGGYWIAPEVRADEAKPANSANEEIRFACIGIGGKGASDSASAARAGKVVAVADVDANQLKRAEKVLAGAKPHTEFRKMLDGMGQEFDAVTISTPDHTHITAAAMAMHLGKHCFCQKPLTRAIAEARTLGDLARSQKVATQMGNQGTANDGLRKAAAYIKSGGIGTVSEVHAWTNRPVWPQGGGRPPEKPAPANLDWDCWLGPAPYRPFAGFRGEVKKNAEGKEEEQPFQMAPRGVLVMGDKDVLYAPGDYGADLILRSGNVPKGIAFTKSPGLFEEFVKAIKGGPAAVSNFPDYAGPLTETILLGNLAVWAADTADVAGKKIEWDSQKLVATNAAEMEPLIRPTPRDGWKV